MSEHEEDNRNTGDHPNNSLREDLMADMQRLMAKEMELMNHRIDQF